MTETIDKKRIWLLLAVGFACGGAALLLGGCQGRTADNMVPAGETVHVVIAADDVAADSAVAAGELP